MNNSRLFIAVDVLDFLRGLKPKEQRILLQRFREIATTPLDFRITQNMMPVAGEWMSMFLDGSPLNTGTTLLTGI